jgi:hypothetical protein
MWLIAGMKARGWVSPGDSFGGGRSVDHSLRLLRSLRREGKHAWARANRVEPTWLNCRGQARLSRLLCLDYPQRTLKVKWSTATGKNISCTLEIVDYSGNAGKANMILSQVASRTFQ